MLLSCYFYTFHFHFSDNWCNRVERDMKRTCNGSDKGYTHTIIGI